jgi:hypothetical protein
VGPPGQNVDLIVETASEESLERLRAPFYEEATHM